MIAFLEDPINFFIVGPCSLESLDQVKPIVRVCKEWGIQFFRAQIFKPRTSPYSFQGLGEKGFPIIEYLQNEGLKLVSEACSLEQLNVVEHFADVIQIGARNMQNFELLKQIGRSKTYQLRKPYVLLKRGFANTLDEWLSAAKYIEESGVARDHILLCERGTRNGAAPTGVTLDLGLAYKVKMETDYRVIIDPSHGSKDAHLVLPLAKAAMALNFDGTMLEVHPRPEDSVSDADQAITVESLEGFLREINFNGKNLYLASEDGNGTYVS